MSQDLSNYDQAYYQREAPEFWFGRHGLLRPDQLAAVCYIYGLPFWGLEPRGQQRVPGLILSIGAGEGHLECWLEGQGETVLGVDPAVGAHELYRGRDLAPVVTEHQVQIADTVLFVEAIEHIPLETTRQIRAWMSPGARLIVVNWPDFHPIEASSDWDHITRIDEALYDELVRGARVITRRGSHLVVEIDG